jgi:hypothetical protein
MRRKEILYKLVKILSLLNEINQKKERRGPILVFLN